MKRKLNFKAYLIGVIFSQQLCYIHIHYMLLNEN